MKKETFFKINRLFLISTLLLGLIIPFINLRFLSNNELFGAQLPTIVIGSTDVNEVLTSTSQLNMINLVIWTIMISLGIFMTIKILSGFIKISKLIKTGDCQKFDVYTLVKSDRISSPMSFMNYLFWNPSIDLESETGQKIFLHEYTHIVQRHSLDLFFIELLKVVFWWNPMLYLYKKEIRDVHEFLADESAVVHSDRQLYGHMLIEQTMSYISGDNMMMANYFFHSQLKKRIEMLSKRKSNKGVMYRYSMFLPILIGLVYICSSSGEINGQVVPNTKKEKTPNIVKENIDTVITFNPETMKESLQIVKSNVYDNVEQMPIFKGCDDQLSGEELQKCSQNKLFNYIFSGLKYPEESKKAGIEGTVVAQFTVYSDGTVDDTKIVKSLDDNCDKQVLTIVNSMPNWIPGKHEGKNVNVQIHLPVKFKLDNKK